jgi:predicted enzyme related to lactoylglutathione lyase
MPNLRSRRRSRRGSKKSAPQPAAPASVVDVAKKATSRGIKLKTLSAVTLLFALLCLAAFAAGRQPIPPGERASMPEMKEHTMFLGLRTAAYQVKDLAKAKAWYAKVTGIQPYFDQPYYVGFNVGGFELGLVPEEGAGEKRRPSGVAYWGVQDAHAAYARLIELGATPVEPLQDVGDGILIGAVHDPFGNVLGVIQNPNFKIAAN